MLAGGQLDALGTPLRLKFRQKPAADFMQHLARKVPGQIFQAHAVSLGGAELDRGQVFLDETSFSFGIRPTRLFTEGGSFQFFDPRSKAAFSKFSVRSLEASAVFFSLALN